MKEQAGAELGQAQVGYNLYLMIIYKLFHINLSKKLSYDCSYKYQINSYECSNIFS